jgi:hypothetical protein
MPHISEDVLLKRLRSVKLHTQRSLEHLDRRQDISEGQRLLTIADRELMQLIKLLEHK